jgi:hypothetical protein
VNKVDKVKLELQDCLELRERQETGGLRVEQALQVPQVCLVLKDPREAMEVMAHLGLMDPLDQLEHPEIEVHLDCLVPLGQWVHEEFQGSKEKEEVKNDKILVLQIFKVKKESKLNSLKCLLLPNNYYVMLL